MEKYILFNFTNTVQRHHGIIIQLVDKIKPFVAKNYIGAAAVFKKITETKIFLCTICKQGCSLVVALKCS